MGNGRREMEEWKEGNVGKEGWRRGKSDIVTYAIPFPNGNYRKNEKLIPISLHPGDVQPPHEQRKKNT